MRPRGVALGAVVVGLLSSCSATAAEPSAGADGLVGQVLSVTSSAGEPFDATANLPTLTFERGGSWSGSTGCDAMSGTYAIDHDRLTLLSATRGDRECVPNDFDPSALVGVALVVSREGSEYMLAGTDLQVTLHANA